MSSKKHFNGLKQLLVGSTAALLTSLSISASAVLRDNAQMVSAQTINSNIPDRIIVKMNDASSGLSAMSANDVETKMSKRAKRKMKKLRRMYNGAYVLKLDKKVSSEEMDKIISDILDEPGVASATVDKLMQPMYEPNDQYYSYQWHYFEPTGGLNLPDAWDITSGSGVVVAVMDTGYLPHADLAANIVGGYDMISSTSISVDGDGRDSDATDPGDACASLGTSSSWHGTHVAGTIAAVTGNGTGVAGVAFGAKVLPIRVLGACGGSISDIADGMVWAAGGSVSGIPNNPYPAQVINLSLGGSGSCDSVTQAAINTARGLGATIVVAAGNSGVNVSNATPANCSGVVSVAATNRSGGRASYSNYGSLVDIAAPGGEMSSSSYDGVLSTLDSGTSTPAGDTYAFYQGTSMAAPHVAGVAALMYSVDPSISPDEVEAILKDTARSFPSSCSLCGDGIVDATAALGAIVDAPLPSPSPSPTPTVVPSPTPTVVPSPSPTPTPGDSELTNGVAVSGISGDDGSEVFYTLSVPAGASDLSFAISGGSGDADLYVSYGEQPTVSSYDCRPYVSGNSESCSFSAPSAGTYYVMIRGYDAYSGLSLVGSYEADSDDGGSSISVDDISGTRGTWQHFSIDVASGTSSLIATITGGSGDADLYVRYGSVPTRFNYDCRPWVDGNEETCEISNPTAGTWFISTYGYSAYSGVDLTADAE